MSRALPITPLSATLGEVILETRFLEQRWPHEADRISMQRALFELHKEVSTALVVLDGGRPVSRDRSRGWQKTIDEPAANRAREAFLATLVLAVLIQRIVVRARRPLHAGRRALTARASRAVARLLDALDPFIARADAALRRVMLEGVSSEQAASQIALPV